MNSSTHLINEPVQITQWASVFSSVNHPLVQFTSVDQLIITFPTMNSSTHLIIEAVQITQWASVFLVWTIL